MQAMTEERYPAARTEKSSSKIEAKIILARCPCAYSRSENLFGMRIQKIGGIWRRTWAFKIDAERAGHEGYGKEMTGGSFTPTAEYPGCPYCRSANLAQCACGKLFCYKQESGQGTMRLTCPWCRQTGEYRSAEAIDVQGGGF